MHTARFCLACMWAISKKATPGAKVEVLSIFPQRQTCTQRIWSISTHSGQQSYICLVTTSGLIATGLPTAAIIHRNGLRTYEEPARTTLVCLPFLGSLLRIRAWGSGLSRLCVEAAIH